MLNHIVLMGRLTRDPELRRTGSGIAVASFSLAVDRDFGSSANNGEKETDFIDIVAWRNTAEFVSKYFTKGRMAVVSGRLQIRNWTDIRPLRAKALYDEDASKKLRKSHENPEIKQIYEEYLGKPNGHKSHELLHTTYEKRELYSKH